MQTIRAPDANSYAYLSRSVPRKQTPPVKPKELTNTDIQFLSRMDYDVEDRRRNAFITELSACPPPKKK